MAHDRMTRVNELILRELGGLFERDIAPYVESLVTVTRVRTTPDLRQARVYVSVMGREEERPEVDRLLRWRRVEFQAHINRRLRLKYTPVLDFVFDESMAEADRILSLLDELERDLGGEPAPSVDSADEDEAP